MRGWRAARAGHRLPPVSPTVRTRDILGKLSSSERDARASGGIGRRAGFRCQCSQGRGGSSPPSRTEGPESRHRLRTSRGSGLFCEFAGCGLWVIGHGCFLQRRLTRERTGRQIREHRALVGDVLTAVNALGERHAEDGKDAQRSKSHRERPRRCRRPSPCCARRAGQRSARTRHAPQESCRSSDVGISARDIVFTP